MTMILDSHQSHNIEHAIVPPRHSHRLRVVGLGRVAARVDAGRGAVHHQVAPQARQLLAAAVAAERRVLVAPAYWYLLGGMAVFVSDILTSHGCRLSGPFK